MQFQFMVMLPLSLIGFLKIMHNYPFLELAGKVRLQLKFRIKKRLLLTYTEMETETSILERACIFLALITRKHLVKKHFLVQL